MREFSVRRRIGNVTAGNIKGLDIKVLFAINAELRLPNQESGVNGWGILALPLPLFMFGILKVRLQRFHLFWMSPPVQLSRVFIFSRTFFLELIIQKEKKH